MIKPPFANYHRAELERLVQEGFEYIERQSSKEMTRVSWHGYDAAMSDFDFQLLCAADYYLRTTEQRD